MPSRAKQETGPQLPYDGTRCFECGGDAASFSARDVPELLEYIGNRITIDQLRAAGARLKGFGTTRCYTAPLSAVSVCARHEKPSKRGAR